MDRIPSSRRYKHTMAHQLFSLHTCHTSYQVNFGTIRLASLEGDALTVRRSVQSKV